MRTLSIALLAVATGCGGPILFAEIESPRVCVTVPQQTFPAAVDVGEQRITYDLATDLPVVGEPNVEYELRILDIALLLRSAAPGDLGGVDQVRVFILPDPANPADPGLEILRYDRSASDPNPTEITATGAGNEDVSSYLAGGQLGLRIEYSGSLPTSDWTADVEGCFYLKATVDYGALLPI